MHSFDLTNNCIRKQIILLDISRVEFTHQHLFSVKNRGIMIEYKKAFNLMCDLR